MKFLLTLLASTVTLFADTPSFLDFSNLKWDEAAYVKMGSAAPKSPNWEFFRGTKVGLGSRVWNQYFGFDASGDYTHHPEYSRVGVEFSVLATPAILQGIYVGAGINLSHVVVIDAAHNRMATKLWDVPFKVGYHIRQEVGRFHFIEAGMTIDKEIFISSGLGF
jgi:hypothetical protein